MDPISCYAPSTGHGASPAYTVSWKADMPKGTPRKKRENNLVERVAAARKLGMSYGQYMAMLRDGRIEDPLIGRK